MSRTKVGGEDRWIEDCAVGAQFPMPIDYTMATKAGNWMCKAHESAYRNSFANAKQAINYAVDFSFCRDQQLRYWTDSMLH